MLSPAMQHRVKAEAGKQVKEAATHASGSLYRTYPAKAKRENRRPADVAQNEKGLGDVSPNPLNFWRARRDSNS